MTPDKPTAPIAADQFETWETLILSEQIPAEDVPALLAENPGFAAWYRPRAEARIARKEP